MDSLGYWALSIKALGAPLVDLMVCANKISPSMNTESHFCLVTVKMQTKRSFRNWKVRLVREATGVKLFYPSIHQQKLLSGTPNKAFQFYLCRFKHLNALVNTNLFAQRFCVSIVLG